MIKIIALAAAMAVASGAASAQAPKQAKKPDGATVYCIALEGTGSRMPKRECRSKVEWERLGVEVKAKA